MGRSIEKVIQALPHPSYLRRPTPRRTSHKVLLSTVCVLSLSACSSPEPATPEAEPSASPTPTPTRYGAGQLIGALPQTPAQLLHNSPVANCLTIRRVCPPASRKGVAWVQGASEAGGITVRVTARAGLPTAESEERLCPQGPTVQAAKNQRVSATRAPWQVRGWRGFVCDQTIEFLNPDGSVSNSVAAPKVLLFNGFHALETDAPTLPVARKLASQYLKRLTR